ncbi:cytochrome c biogenesis protein CcsA [Dysgonomonas sp. Marseille-P4361]|uniref:cytochrome c biogenesis protein CcsA n=1 Tax=Dysgonomonas sp. Marseille-P4361 TaxID=2161820 RepID=UPI000D54CEAD|nr:cytochrome c biogenesis protein CcsA [Dysgonomonas sp. Marseille-P4361]
MKLKNFLVGILYSYKASIIMMLLYALFMAIATFVEKYTSTETAKIWIYYSPLFILLQLLLVLNFIFSSLKNKLFKKKKWGGIVVHFSLIIILIGAFITHVSGVEGTIHIREGESVSHMVVQTNKGMHKFNLPFSIKLDKFTLTRYPGSSSPSSYESLLTLHTEGRFEQKVISMNNVLDIKGYRLFQASYDTDEKGTILSVNRDVLGRTITYAGYALLIVGFLLSFVVHNSRFRYLIARLKEIKAQKSLLILLLCFSIPLSSLIGQNAENHIVEALQKNRVDKEHAAKFGALPMQATDGRIEPINTFSSEVLRKLHSSDKFGDLNSDQFLLSVLTFPEMWMHIPLISYKNDDIAFNYDISEKMCAYTELFDSNGNYKLHEDLDKVFAKPISERTKFDKDLIKLDEQINILHQLLGRKMVKIFPNELDKNHSWFAYGDNLSTFSSLDSSFVKQNVEHYLQSVKEGVRTDNWADADKILEEIKSFQLEKNKTVEVSSDKIDAELLYNELNINRFCKKVYLILGGVLLLLAFINILKKRKSINIAFNILLVFVVLGVLYHLFGMAMRWYIAGYAPWSNSYETMIYVSAITVIAGLVFARQSQLTVALATLFAGVILFVSGLNWMNPQISPLVPVLKSPWLMIHVAVIVAAYGFFGISFLLGTTNLVLLRINKNKKNIMLKSRIEELCIINEMSLWAGLALMTIGTFLGAIWANESWGRYWGWDPKETWALVTVVVYAIVTHVRLVKKWDNPYLFNLLSVIAFACVLMTYFGVNYYLSGMHSYG